MASEFDLKVGGRRFSFLPSRPSVIEPRLLLVSEGFRDRSVVSTASNATASWPEAKGPKQQWPNANE